jgi:hypothetical protein
MASSPACFTNIVTKSVPRRAYQIIHASGGRQHRRKRPADINRVFFGQPQTDSVTELAKHHN